MQQPKALRENASLLLPPSCPQGNVNDEMMNHTSWIEHFVGPPYLSSDIRCCKLWLGTIQLQDMLSSADLIGKAQPLKVPLIGHQDHENLGKELWCIHAGGLYTAKWTNIHDRFWNRTIGKQVEPTASPLCQVLYAAEHSEKALPLTDHLGVVKGAKFFDFNNSRWLTNFLGLFKVMFSFSTFSHWIKDHGSGCSFFSFLGLAISAIFRWIVMFQDGSKSRGSLEMNFQWLTLADEVALDMAGCVVMIEVQNLMAKEAASVVAKLGGKDWNTKK